MIKTFLRSLRLRVQLLVTGLSTPQHSPHELVDAWLFDDVRKTIVLKALPTAPSLQASLDAEAAELGRMQDLVRGLKQKLSALNVAYETSAKVGGAQLTGVNVRRVAAYTSTDDRVLQEALFDVSSLNVTDIDSELFDTSGSFQYSLQASASQSRRGEYMQNAWSYSPGG